MGMKLFENGDGNLSEDDISKIEINKEFARRYEHNKKREDLQKLQELKKKGVISESSSSSEDDDDDEEEEGFSVKSDLKFFDALLKVKNQEPVLNDKEVKLFESESESEHENDNNNHDDKKARKKKKPMYLKDVVSKHLLEEGPEFEDDNDGDNDGKKKVKSYLEEQEELRREFLDAVNEEGNDDEGEDEAFFKVKEGGGKDEQEDEEGGVFGKKLDEYFGEDAKLDDNMMFLKDYFRNRMWESKENEGGVMEEFGFSEDEEEIEKQEDYERDFNFRFEENAGDRVMGHSRVIEGSVRKKTNARKSQRERKEERMVQAEFERKEELKHLKNLKKKEIKEKLKKIKETAGIGEDGVCLLDEDDLEEEFDPDQYDRKMKEAFGDGYYGAEDFDPEFASDAGEDDEELEKPDFDKEDELLGLPKGWDDVNEAGKRDGFLTVREKILESKMEVDNNEKAEDEEELVPGEGKRKKKRKKPSEVANAVREQLMEEYYKLDYEDTIGDLKTRFKYKPVNAKRYGLRTEEVLAMDDRELNQYVSIKKLAPYREKEWKVPRIKIYNQKHKNNPLLQGENSDLRKPEKKKPKSNTQTEAVSVVEHQEEPNGSVSNLSRKSKRRKRQAELKLSQSRLMAYGKLPSKSKNKKD